MRRFIAFCFCMACALPVAAQSSCTVSATNGSCTTGGNLAISVTVGRVVQLGLSGAATTLTPPTVADYNAGFVTTVGPSGTVRSNAPWTLSISAGSSTWVAVDTQSEPARTNKPAGDLGWSLSPAGPFTDLSTAPVTVTSGNTTSGLTSTLYYRTRYNWTLDTPGNYSMQVVLTLVAP